LTFPLWVPTGERDDEHRYCELVAKQPGYVCLDRDFARTPFHPKFELCDIVGPNDELVHVKWFGRATAASHLYTQASAAAWSLREEAEALQQLNVKVRSVDRLRVRTEPSGIVLAIAGRGWNVTSCSLCRRSGCCVLSVRAATCAPSSRSLRSRLLRRSRQSDCVPRRDVLVLRASDFVREALNTRVRRLACTGLAGSAVRPVGSAGVWRHPVGNIMAGVLDLTTLHGNDYNDAKVLH
jgi:hypothetical protein